MTSKTIRITEDIYNSLVALKDNNESFSQLFDRMINLYQTNLKSCFGTWKMSDNDYKTIWGDIVDRSDRKRTHFRDSENST